MVADGRSHKVLTLNASCLLIFFSFDLDTLGSNSIKTNLRRRLWKAKHPFQTVAKMQTGSALLQWAFASAS